eukprot:2092249-Amphidinium_carterae.1
MVWGFGGFDRFWGSQQWYLKSDTQTESHAIPKCASVSLRALNHSHYFRTPTMKLSGHMTGRTHKRVLPTGASTGVTLSQHRCDGHNAQMQRCERASRKVM